MELKNLLTPWNWFKKEEEQAQSVSNRQVTKSNDSPLLQLHRDIDRIFDNFFQGFPFSPPSAGNGRWGSGLILPQVDIGEGKKEYTITVEVPGVEEKDIDLTYEDGTLMIRGEKRYEQEDHDKHYHRVERSYGSFQRLLSLPADADEQNIRAKFKSGVLTITIPKNPNAKPPVRKIAIA